jgi:type II secretory pathway pseudopilin PulG
MIETMMVMAVISILLAMMVPKIGRTLQSVQVRRSASIVAGDLEAAFTMAARQRKPMRIAWPGGTVYTVADRTGGTVRLSRRLNADSDLGTMVVNFSATPIDVFPHGVASAPLTVTITSGASTRTIVLTTAGQVRVQ